MKLRNRYLIQAAAWSIASGLRLWNCCLRYRAFENGQHTNPWDPAVPQPYLYCIWHESLYGISLVRSHRPAAALVSQSNDGELLSRVCRQFGLGTIRGSSSRGGEEALKEILHDHAQSHLVIAPDGPRGPRRQIKRGVIHLAAWTGRPIVPVGIGFSRAWRMNSWDRFALPLPFSTLTYYAAPLVHVPESINKRQAEQLSHEVEERLNQATAAAQAWAESGLAQPPEPPVAKAQAA